MWSRLCASVSHSDGPFFLLCCVGLHVVPSFRLCSPQWWPFLPVVLCVSACGPVYALVYPTVMGRSSCCVVCVCMWFRLCASVSHSDGPFFLSVFCVSVCCPVYAIVYRCVSGRSSYCVSVCGPVYALVYPIVTGRSSCCVVSVCGPVYALVYPIVTGRSSCCVCLYVVLSMR
jgi:hypothetical protein